MRYKFVDLELTEEEKKYCRPLWDKYFYINNKRIDLPGEVFLYVEIDRKLLVLMEDYYMKDRNRNIWCYNSGGEKLWEVDARCTSMGKNIFTDPYISISTKPRADFSDAEDKIFVQTFDGFVGSLDIETGKVSKWKWYR